MRHYKSIKVPTPSLDRKMNELAVLGWKIVSVSFVANEEYAIIVAHRHKRRKV